MGSNGINIQAASDTAKLVERINKNQESQTFCLEDWIFSDMDLSKFTNILELCSGTGKQSEYIVKLSNSAAKINLSDISEDSSRLLKEKFSKNKQVTIHNQNMDELLDSITPGFDLILVSYGLYYSNYREDILTGKISNLLNQGGMLIVVGPYRDNNYELFGFLRSHGVSIPRSVSYSCDGFMDNILHEMLVYSKSVTMDFADNVQKWSSSDSLLTYWKNSTFYDPEKEEEISVSMRRHFENSSSFHITKKIAKFIFVKKS